MPIGSTALRDEWEVNELFDGSQLDSNGRVTGLPQI
jgi:hypothetical protein